MNRMFVWPIRRLNIVDSTNEEAKRWLVRGAPDGAMVIADAQSAGRGRMGRKWFSPPGGNLYFSQVFKESPDNLRRLPMVGALAAREAVARTLFPFFHPSIEWPNDIMVLKMKVAGILCEAVGENEAVLGVGVNINIGARQFPSKLRRPAASLRMLAGRRFSRDLVLGYLAQALKLYRRKWLQSPCQLVNLFRRHCCTLGREVAVELLAGRLLKGRAVDIDEDGALHLETTGGRRERVLAGEIVRLI